MIFDKDHNQQVMRDLHDQGIEVTEHELIAERKAAFSALRKAMRLRGYVMPESDEELLKLIAMARRMPT